MASFLFKGSQIEPLYGTVKFCFLLLELTASSQVLYILIALSGVGGILGPNLMSSCAVGFSAVLFAMKVILTHDKPGWSTIMGISIPTRYLAWAELAYIQLITPNASALGHACGILAGVLHVYVTKPLFYHSYVSGVFRRRGGSRA